jgi:hypothetical protein
MRYFVRFVGDVIPKLGVNLPPQVFEGCFVDVNTDNELVDFVNEYSLQLLQRGGLAVLVDENIVARPAEERKASPMPRPKKSPVAFGMKMIVPMHMISKIVPDVMFVPPQLPAKPLLPELAVLETDDNGAPIAPKETVQ